jgi:hypothetical protein
MAGGWRLVALEWEREAEDEAAPARGWSEEIPYGLQVSDDATGLVENPSETEVMVIVLDGIVEDCPLSRIADELNQRGYRTRLGGHWTAATLFNLLPRMIAAGPKLFASEQWTNRRQRFPRISAI